VVARWQEAAERELRALEQAPEKTRRISNPYNPGPALERSNKLFVGRYDLASQLGEALSRKDHRPTFLLYGERRMGKSSVLKHLPDLLGARFLPVFYDLQSPDSTASIAAFLGMVAEEIALAMEARGLKVKKLAYERLQEARRENEATVYYVFNRWLKGIEKTLEREDRTLLLMFDEYEKLDRAGTERYLQLQLLLNWFRSIMQHHPRLAFLFSGVQTFGDMGMNWAGYFVSVQTLKVSFLQPAEAHQLITRPIQGVPVEQIFAQGVIEEILRVTGCHPFLVQALSSALIDALNSRRRNQIEMQDVEKAINAVFKNWGSTYFRDLWERTAPAQRACLSALKEAGGADLPAIQQRTGLDRQTVYGALEILLERDLVCNNEQGIYQLAAPLFRAWVERNDSSIPMLTT
jgi:DNA-binding transcriptional ArsR family regulator